MSSTNDSEIKIADFRLNCIIILLSFIDSWASRHRRIAGKNTVSNWHYQNWYSSMHTQI
jgi:hypothetical protein